MRDGQTNKADTVKCTIPVVSHIEKKNTVFSGPPDSTPESAALRYCRIFKLLPASCPDQSTSVKPGSECYVGCFSIGSVTDAVVGFLLEKNETHSLHLLSIVVIKTMIKSNLRRKVFYLAYIQKSQFIIEEIQDNNLSR